MRVHVWWTFAPLLPRPGIRLDHRRVPAKSHWATTPRQSIEAECAHQGATAVIAGCVRLIHGKDTDAGLILALGGPAANRFLDGRSHNDRYWLRVWGLRGLLWAWDDSAEPAIRKAVQKAVRKALVDESWRVREMAAKVISKHTIGDAMAAVAALRDDPVARVRTAAERAVRLLSQAGA